MCFVTERKLRNSGSAYSTNAKGTGKTQEWTRLTWIANHNHGKLSLNCPRLTSHGVQVAPLTIPHKFNDTKKSYLLDSFLPLHTPYKSKLGRQDQVFGKVYRDRANILSPSSQNDMLTRFIFVPLEQSHSFISSGCFTSA